MFGSVSELSIRIALGVAAVSYAAASLALLHMVLLRVARGLRQRREAKIAAEWRPLIRDCVLGDATPEKRLPRSARGVVLNLWLQARDVFQGEAVERLNRLASLAGLDRHVDALLASGTPSDRLQAIVAAGYLADPDRWELLSDQLRGADSLLALAAARALMQIDAGRALPRVLDEVQTREVWDGRRAQAVFEREHRERLTGELRERITTVEPQALRRLLNLVPMTDARRLGSAILDRLDASDDPELIADGLRVIAGSAEHGRVRRYLDHPVWFVRLRALACMDGGFADEDRPRLQALTQDENEWVALRAQQQLDQLGARP